MININDESDDEYNEVSYDEELSDESLDEADKIDETNELILDDSYDSDDSENSDDPEADIAILKKKMIFPKKSQNVSKIPQVIQMPQLKGILLPKPKPIIELPKKNVKKYSSEEIDNILQNMPGINVTNNPINYDRKDIYDLLQKEAQESVKDFDVRKSITLKIADIKDPKLKNTTCVVIGLMIAKKLRFGVKYDENVEILLRDILDILKT